jgi:hypothetical protein
MTDTTCNKSECAQKLTNGVCASKFIQRIVFDALNVPTMAQAKQKINNSSEATVLEATKNIISKSDANKIDEELEMHFKVPGHIDERVPLTNYDIDKTLKQWALIDFPYLFTSEFAMADFDYGNYYDITKRSIYDLHVKFPKIKCYACVLNTDVSDGPGKHWVCLFVDLRNKDEWSIEYFDSLGEKPFYSINYWMRKNKDCVERQLNQKIKICLASKNICHQKLNTECGMYCLYYIRKRLEQTPVEHFSKAPVPDDFIAKFREYTFRPIIK